MVHTHARIVTPDDLHIQMLPQATRRAFLRCIEHPFFAKFSWYLAGGTALALHEGHRQSVDLDFFTSQDGFPELVTERELMKMGEWTTSFRERGTLYGIFHKAKMSFIAYPFFIPSKEKVRCGNVTILLPKDIAAMKIAAISQRGRKRDFVDLFWYCTHHEPLSEVLRNSIDQFPGQENNINHILRSLTYFDDAETDPMPKLFFKASWRAIKIYMRSETARAARVILHLK